MSSLVHKLGLSPSLSFHDVYSLTDPSLLDFVPRPAHALLLVFPVSSAYDSSRLAEDASLPEYTGSGPDEEVLWYKQTIGNACGLIGLLHAASNGLVRDFIGMLYSLIKHGKIAQNSLLLAHPTPLDTLISTALPLRPDARARVLETSSTLAAAHASAASQGDTAPPEASAEVDLHYVAFVKSKENNLWELDGERKGPLNRGKLDEGDDILSEKAIEMGPMRYLKREEGKAGGELRFSIVALGPSLD
jgi:ubiquitin carboxyl-terminal hydrolase L3